MSHYSERARKELFVKQRVQYLEDIQKQVKANRKEELLDAWSAYIGWARQTLLNGGNRGEFAVILNDCIRQVCTKDMAKDLRDNYQLVRITAEFADYCDKPMEFLQWMEKRQIGLSHAKYWLTKARVLEDAAQDVAGAQTALTEGIRRGAAPVDKLKSRLRQLEARVAARLADPSPADDGPQQRRAALGALASAAPIAGLTTRGHHHQENPGQTRQRRFQVADGADDNDDKMAGGAADEKWLDFGSQREAVKENADVARQWRKTKLPQKMGVAATAAPANGGGFAILEDGADEEDDENAPLVAATIKPLAPNPSVAGAKAPSKGGKIAIFQEDENDHHPLFLGGGKSAAAPLPAPKTKHVPKLDPKKERPIYSEASLMQETLSFEELRAAKWHAANQIRLERERMEQAQRQQEEEAKMKKLKQQQQEEAQRVKGIAKSKSSAAAAPALFRQKSGGGGGGGASNKLLDESRYDAEPTMDTMNYEALVRNAAKTTNLLDDLRNVFDDTIDLQKQRQRRIVREPTVNTRLAMEEVERMFGESLAFNDSVLPTSSNLSRLDGLPGIAAPKRPVLPEVEVYEEDSLESFRTSMSQTANQEAPVAKQPSAPVVATRPVVAVAAAPSKVTPPAALVGGGAFTIFEDDDDEEEDVAFVAGSANNNNVSATERSTSFESVLVAGNGPSKGHISFHPMSPIAEDRQSNSQSNSDDLHASHHQQQQQHHHQQQQQQQTKVVLDNPWSKLAVVPIGKLKSWTGFHDYGSKKNTLDDSKYLELDDGGVYDLSCQIGGGVESNVYRSEDVDNLDGEAVYALKITNPANPWEFNVNRLLGQRCSPSELRFFGTVASYHRYANKGMMFSVFREHGTLADLLRLWKSPQGIPEEVALFYAGEILRVVELVHSKKVLHNDVTLENILLVLDAESTCANPQQNQHLELIDFSCALDLADLDPRTVFRSQGRCSFQCPEMSAGTPWTFQQDYCGVANAVHWLLFGKELSVVQRADKRYEPNTKPCAGWQTDLWDEFFLSLLNGPALCTGQHGESAAFLEGIRKFVQERSAKLSEKINALLQRQTLLINERK